MKIVIVGGVAGGATAAARARRLSEDAEIVVFERGSHVSFANCGLPYYIGGTIEDRDALLLQTAEGFWKRYRIKVVLNTEVTGIDPQGKTVGTRNLQDGTERDEAYDKLILAPGAAPLRPPLPGIDDPGRLLPAQHGRRGPYCFRCPPMPQGRGGGRRFYRPGSGRESGPPRQGCGPCGNVASGAATAGRGDGSSCSECAARKRDRTLSEQPRQGLLPAGRPGKGGTR